MRAKVKYKLFDPDSFRQKLIVWMNQYPVFCYLDSNNYYGQSKAGLFYHTYDTVAGIDFNDILEHGENDAFASLKEFVHCKNDWLFGYFSYDLKNEIENLTSGNFDGIGFPDLKFYQPKLVFVIKENNLEIQYLEKYYSKDKVNLIINSIENIEIIEHKKISDLYIKRRIPPHEYTDTVNKIKKHIFRGDIYEINYCQEYYCENQNINPLDIYTKLKNVSPTPFSCFFRLFDKYLISASPERFLKKMGSKIISQPMKGTINRGKSERSDQHLKNKLKLDPKEIAENVMIVDLVRNDLSKSAAKESVKVEELCGIYTFEQVHQMVSTISAELESEDDMIDTIKNAFPMGSMTGAPKVKAMELIEKYENTKRGMYSGAVGYFTPENDFDFNVVIRSILYNSTKQYLSYMVGSAITAKSIPENEYNECLLKAKAINQVLN